jgi:hypothetical protein
MRCYSFDHLISIISWVLNYSSIYLFTYLFVFIFYLFLFIYLSTYLFLLFFLFLFIYFYFLFIFIFYLFFFIYLFIFIYLFTYLFSYAFACLHLDNLRSCDVLWDAQGFNDESKGSITFRNSFVSLSICLSVWCAALRLLCMYTSLPLRRVSYAAYER